jgi:hypothetical protein
MIMGSSDQIQVETAHDHGDGCLVLQWAASGGMALTGWPGQAPLVSPAPAFSLLAKMCRELATATGGRVCPDPARLLTGRAGLRGWRRSGRVSANGTTRLLRAADGWCAITLSRPDDLAAVPAILGVHGVDDPWASLEFSAREMSAQGLAARAQLLGVPGALLPPPHSGNSRDFRCYSNENHGSFRLDGAVVVDLSAMWAGPLCGQLLARAGATVIKVESATRPDGARRDPRFFDWLHAGQKQVMIDFGTQDGRGELRELLRTADIVIEASRPRALAQLGLGPDTGRNGQVWLSITGYGRAEPDKVAFGDDAAVAGGLVGWDSDGDPVFCADAIADPLTGVCGALAVASAVTVASAVKGAEEGGMGRRAGGVGEGHLIDLSMRDVAAAFATAAAGCPAEHPVRRAGFGWVAECARLDSTQWVLPPC